MAPIRTVGETGRLFNCILNLVLAEAGVLKYCRLSGKSELAGSTPF